VAKKTFTAGETKICELSEICGQILSIPLWQTLFTTGENLRAFVSSWQKKLSPQVKQKSANSAKSAG